MTTSQSNGDYAAFLDAKTQLSGNYGFDPIEIPSFLKPFQAHLTEWAIRRGRGALLEDCGLGKSPQALSWADNVVRHTNGRVLILTPLSVSGQMLREAGKFGFDAEVSRNGKFTKRLVITNYERLHYFTPSDFAGVVADEASILKNCDGSTRAAVIEFMRTIAYRLLCTATAAPNDFVELGNHAEALGEMGFQDMITRFFKQETSKDHLGWGRTKYRLRAHGERDFWRWICSWSRAIRRPSDLGFSDDGYIRPPVIMREHIVEARTLKPGFLFSLPAMTLPDQKEERRRTINERCEKVAEIVQHDRPAIVWTHLNPEGDLCEKLISDSVQISGRDSDDEKEAKLLAFCDKRIRVLVTKPILCGFGLNLQHCAHQTFFPSHSWEQFYQCKHRSDRYGQQSQVEIDLVASEGEMGVSANLERKSQQADLMFANQIQHMNDQLRIERSNTLTQTEELPSWLSSTN